MIERLFRVGFFSLVLAGVWFADLSARAQQPPPISKTYILSQATCPPVDPAQITKVPLGATVQVQLPGNHAPKGKWQFIEPLPKNLKAKSARIINSKDRIPGLDAIYIFNFTAVLPGPATITMRATPPISVTYPDLKNPDRVMCPHPENGEPTYKLETLKFYLIVDDHRARS
jgi:hypothetical protein